MAYVFRGTLCGYICADCSEQLSNVRVRLYRSRTDQNVTVLAAANPKNTLTLLTDDAVNSKASSLLAETETGADGSFTFELGEKESALRETLDLFVASILNGVFPAFPADDDDDFNACKYCPVNHSCRTRHDFVEKYTVTRYGEPRTLLGERE